MATTLCTCLYRYEESDELSIWELVKDQGLGEATLRSAGVLTLQVLIRSTMESPRAQGDGQRLGTMPNIGKQLTQANSYGAKVLYESNE